MKKYLFLAILACLVILPGCKKNKTDNVSHKLLLLSYDACNQIIGSEFCGVRNIFVAQGWQMADSVDDGAAFLKKDGVITREIDVDFTINNTDTIICKVECFVANTDGTGDDCMCADDMKALFQHLGQSPYVKGELVPFEKLCYGNNDDELEFSKTDYQSALNSIVEACSYNTLEIYWSDVIHSIEIDRDKLDGKPVVTIAITAKQKH